MWRERGNGEEWKGAAGKGMTPLFVDKSNTGLPVTVLTSCN